MTTSNQGIDERLFNVIVETNSKAPFYLLTGITTKTLGPGWVEMSVQTREEHGNPLGITHGGLVSTLADAAMANAVRTTGKKGVTVNYSINFFTTAPVGKEMVGRGKVDRVGSNLHFASAEVVCDGKVIATTQGTFFIIGEIELD